MLCFLYVLFLFSFQVKILPLPLIINNLFPIAIMRFAIGFFSGRIQFRQRALQRPKSLFSLAGFSHVMSVLIFYPLSIFWKKRILTPQYCFCRVTFSLFSCCAANETKNKREFIFDVSISHRQPPTHANGQIHKNEGNLAEGILRYVARNINPCNNARRFYSVNIVAIFNFFFTD